MSDSPCTNTYPARPKFFANKFIRLMGKVCLANEIGADACWLLANVAMIEDAKGYCGAVTFYNGQLMPFVGAGSPEALNLMRGKAVAAGWLHYEHGGRSVPGRYWVTVPPGLVAVDDFPADENPAEYGDTPPNGAAVSRQEAGLSPRLEPRKSGTKRDTTEIQPREKPARTAALSSLSCPDPKDTFAAAPRPPAESVEPKPEPKSPPKPAKSLDTQPGHAEAVAGFTAAWRAKYGIDYRFGGAKDGKAVKAMLKHLGGDVAEFLAAAARFLADNDDFYAAGSRHSLGKFNQNFARWLVAAPRAASRHAYDAPE